VEIFPHTENPALFRVAQPIAENEISSEKIRTLIAEMKRLLALEEYGVALAAPQVGAPIRLFIVSGKALAKRARSREKGGRDDEDQVTTPMPKEDEVYINPALLKLSRAKSPKHEGCLSVRGTWGVVPRAEKATIHAWNEKGEEFTRGASGFLAHIFQHETDHLEGILYTSKATRLYDDGDHEHEEA
jgi:peptide deformylase